MMKEMMETILLRGYLWKYPSEGSNRLSISSDMLNITYEYGEEIFPMKCINCHAAWASSSEELEEHLSTCQLKGKNGPFVSPKKKLGVPRRFWFELDGTSNKLQWREHEDSHHEVSNFIDLETVQNILPHEDRLLIMVAHHRRVVLQAQDTTERNFWLQSLQEHIFVCGRPPGATQTEAILSAINNNSEPELRQIREFSLDSFFELDAENNTFLTIACKVGCGPDVISYLVQVGIDPNLMNNDGESPLLILSAAGEIDVLASLNEVVEWLLGIGANTSAVDDQGWTAFHYSAAVPNGADLLRLLCEYDEQAIDVVDLQGETALHIAARQGFNQNIETLLQTAASPSLYSWEGYLPIDLARLNHHSDCIELLESYADEVPTTTESTNFEQMTESHYYPLQTSFSESTEHNYERSAMEDVEIPSPSLSSHLYSTSREYSEIRLSSQCSHHIEGAQGGALDWTELTDENGNVYYFNNTTGDSQWEYPYVPMEEEGTTRSSEERHHSIGTHELEYYETITSPQGHDPSFGFTGNRIQEGDEHRYERYGNGNSSDNTLHRARTEYCEYQQFSSPQGSNVYQKNKDFANISKSSMGSYSSNELNETNAAMSCPEPSSPHRSFLETSVFSPNIAKSLEDEEDESSIRAVEATEDRLLTRPRRKSCVASTDEARDADRVQQALLLERKQERMKRRQRKFKSKHRNGALNTIHTATHAVEQL